MTGKTACLSCALLALGIVGAALAADEPVPGVYQDLYAQLDADIRDFHAKIATVWNGKKFPVAYSGQLTFANSNNGPNLLKPASLDLIQQEIGFLKGLGVKVVAVEVSFPMLNPGFLNGIDPTYQEQFAALYAKVAAAIRAQGMQVIVESQSMMPNGLQSESWAALGLPKYYAGLSTFPEYVAARAQTVGIVAKTMKPDFFILQEEPDTEAAQSRQTAVGTVMGSTTMLNQSIIAARGAGVSGMKIGAGFGSWLQAYALFANSYTRQNQGRIVTQPRGAVEQPCLDQPLDFLDLHLFPITERTAFASPPPRSQPCRFPNFWQNALDIVNTAREARLPVAISQTWLRKVRDQEWLQPIHPGQVSGGTQEAREAYGFWQPLDLAFLQTVSELADYGHAMFLVPFNTQNFSAYLTWGPNTALDGEGGSNAPAEVFKGVQVAGRKALASGVLTRLGTGYRALIESSQK